MKLKSVSILVAATLLFLSGCNHDEPKAVLPGEVSFSFKNKSGDGFASGRTTEEGTPAFASYTIKKADGSLISSKIELFDFNGDFVTAPQQLPAGHYTLEQFFILDADNETIYASPLEGSELAYLVEHPLPLSFDIAADETTEVIPEVVALEDHSPADFGYVKFGFAVVDKFDFDVTVTIADTDPHPSIDYMLEIIAKDAPLGNVQWSKTVAMNTLGEIHIPAKYAHYTFRAVKQGYISHVQHFLKDDLSHFGQLSFEFLPESLNDFVVKQLHDGQTFYFPKNPCKLFARLDLPEGLRMEYTNAWRTATAHPQSSLEVADFLHNECFDVPYDPEYPDYLLCSTVNVNLWGNTPYAQAQNYCDRIDLSRGNPSFPNLTLNDVFYTSSISVQTQPASFTDVYITWYRGNITGAN